MKNALMFLGFSSLFLACAAESELGPIDETASAQLSIINDDHEHSAPALEAGEFTSDVDDGDVGTLACDREFLVGAGSCKESCWRKPDLDGYCSGSVAWECGVVNYQHRSNGWWDPGQYTKTGGPWLGYYYCFNYNPMNCPSFCN